MDSLDIRVLKRMRSWRMSNDTVLWVTILQTWGSSPRPIGSMMAINQDGEVVGSVSGGCIEDDLIRERQDYIEQAVAQSAPLRLKYGIQADEAHRFGLPCGGVIELLVEANPSVALLDELLDAITTGQTIVKECHTETGAVRLYPGSGEGSLEVAGPVLRHFFGPQYRLLLIGAGQLSEYLATMAVFNGFQVWVCDPRAQYRGDWQVPNVELVTGMPDDEVLAFKPTSRSAIVALTHDPKLDDMALLEALMSPAFYVGAIGSRRNQDQRRARLKEHFDIPTEALARLRGPVGIYIGSKTPAEIAVSIMADIIAVKNNVPLPEELAIEKAKAVHEQSLMQQADDAMHT